MNRSPPVHVNGSGKLLEFWVDKQLLFTDLKWNHHLCINDTQLIVDGAVYTQWSFGEQHARAVFPAGFFSMDESE